MKVRAHLAWMAIAILLPVMIFSAIALNMLLTAERAAARHAVQETARASALIVDREIDNAETALQVLATSPHLAQQDWRGFYEQAAAVNRGNVPWIVLTDERGRMLLNTAMPFGAALPSTSEEGLPVFEKNGAVVSNLMRDALLDRYIVKVEFPVLLPDGRRYVLSQHFPAEYFNRVFPKSKMSNDWTIGVFDRKGATIARNRTGPQFIGKPPNQELLLAIDHQQEGELRQISRDGIELHTLFTHSALSGWAVVVGVPTEEIESSARRAATLSLFGLMAAIGLAALFASLFGKRLVGAIAGAAESAAALGRGQPVKPAHARVEEVDALLGALEEAGKLLKQAESDRAHALEIEQQARKLAEEQNRAKDEFLAMLGHELRNPLAAISGAVALMEISEGRPDNIRHARGVIARQSMHLSRIVDDLLDLSRLISGKIVLEKQHVDLAEAAQACVATLQASGRLQDHALNIQAEPAWIEADPTRLDQLITNLLVNAVKYTPSGGRIEVCVRREVRPELQSGAPAEEGYAVFSVSDSGIGMPAELLPRIFDVFVQGSASLDRSQGGLGIGLTLVRQLAIMHGGTVEAHSGGVGQGSTFILRLPLSKQAAPVPPAAPEHAAGGSVLLIEDNQDARSMMSKVLSLSGYRVFEAASGAEGIALAKRERPALAVVDIGMPEMDGYQVARRLRADPETADIGLIALTGYSQPADRRQALDAGFDAHLVKPAALAELLQAMAHHARREPVKAG